jgi:hypothetical protein
LRRVTARLIKSVRRKQIIELIKPDVRKRRKVVRGQKKKREDKNQETEGNTYEAGAF